MYEREIADAEAALARAEAEAAKEGAGPRTLIIAQFKRDNLANLRAAAARVGQVAPQPPDSGPRRLHPNEWQVLDVLATTGPLLPQALEDWVNGLRKGMGLRVLSVTTITEQLGMRGVVSWAGPKLPVTMLPYGEQLHQLGPATDS